MNEKKTAVITIRTSPTTREKLEKEALQRGWTISTLAERILTAYTEEPKKEIPINFIGNTIGQINIGEKND